MLEKVDEQINFNNVQLRNIITKEKKFMEILKVIEPKYYSKLVPFFIFRVRLTATVVRQTVGVSDITARKILKNLEKNKLVKDSKPLIIK